MPATITPLEASFEIPYHTLRYTTFHLFLSMPQALEVGVKHHYQVMERAFIAAYSARLRWKFLRSCLQEQVLPHSLQHLMSYNASGEAFPDHWKALLKDRIIDAAREKQDKFIHRNHCKNKFNELCPTELIAQSHQLAFRRAQHLDGIQQVKHQSKLQRLCSKSLWANASLTDCVVNLSDHQLTDNELQVLGLGMSFALPPRPETCTMSVLAALQDLESTAKEIAPELRTIKGFAITCLNDLSKSNGELPQRLHSAKKGLQYNKNIIIVKADKGSKIVVLNKQDYISAGEAMLADTNVYEKLNVNPLRTESANFNTELDRIFGYMQGKKAPKRFKSRLPKLPFLKLGPKIHKPGNTFRPKVSQSKSFQKPLAKHLAKILSPLLGSFSPAHL